MSFEALREYLGHKVIAAELHEARVWAARPVRVLAIDADLLTVHFARGSTWLRPVWPNGAVHRLPEGPWKLVETIWKHDNIWFLPEGEPFAIHTMRSRQQTRLEGWYINVQRPVEVAERGFAYMDRTLDVLVSSDLGSWRLKDEDELERAVEIGLYGRDDVSEIRQAAMNGLAFLRDRASQLRSLHDSPHLKSEPLKVNFREVWT